MGKKGTYRRQRNHYFRHYADLSHHPKIAAFTAQCGRVAKHWLFDLWEYMLGEGSRQFTAFGAVPAAITPIWCLNAGWTVEFTRELVCAALQTGCLIDRASLMSEPHMLWSPYLFALVPPSRHIPIEMADPMLAGWSAWSPERWLGVSKDSVTLWACIFAQPVRHDRIRAMQRRTGLSEDQVKAGIVELREKGEVRIAREAYHVTRQLTVDDMMTYACSP